MLQTIQSINPTSGKQIALYPVFNSNQIHQALTSSKIAFDDWQHQSFENRALVLKDIATRLRIEKEYLALLSTLEMGKPIQQSRDEVEKCAKTLEFYALNGSQFLQNEYAATDAIKSYVTFRPLGVILGVMPWNFPFWQLFRAFAPIVMAGNVMLLKHASNVTGCALAIEKIIKDSIAPKNLLQTLIVPGNEMEQIISNPIIAGVTFTGSTEAGGKVAAIAGKNIKKCVLELGGNDAYIILQDADLELASTLCVKGRLINTGQSCVAAKRFIVVKEVRAAFETLVTYKMNASTMGDPLDENSKIGPMARHDLRNDLHEQVIKSIEMGAQLLCGGYIPEEEGAYYPPTVLTGVTKAMPAYHEELFGPVASVIVAENETEALLIANDTIFGLGGGIFSKNIEHAEYLAANRLDAGLCFVNDHVHSNPELPFGGIKQSGYGRELGSYGIREFVNVKTVYVK